MSVDEKNLQYWDGTENKVIRFYFYSQRGLALLNEARYLIMGAFALYYTLRLDNPIYLVLIFIGALPVMIFLGWLSVHRMGKVIDYLNVRFSTYYAKKQFDIFEGILKEIKLLNSKSENTSGNYKENLSEDETKKQKSEFCLRCKNTGDVFIDDFYTANGKKPCPVCRKNDSCQECGVDKTVKYFHVTGQEDCKECKERLLSSEK